MEATVNEEEKEEEKKEAEAKQEEEAWLEVSSILNILIKYHLICLQVREAFKNSSISWIFFY